MEDQDAWRAIFVYREHAARCRHLARLAMTPTAEETYRLIADSYDRLADQSVPQTPARIGASGWHAMPIC